MTSLLMSKCQEKISKKDFACNTITLALRIYPPGGVVEGLGLLCIIGARLFLLVNKKRVHCCMQLGTSCSHLLFYVAHGRDSMANYLFYQSD